MFESYREIHFEEIDSTSSFIKREYLKLQNLTIVSSDYQSAGRGRNTRQWISVKGANLLFSLFINKKELTKYYSSLSIVSAVAISKCLEALGVKNVSIKWPNDVYINSKKVCGILLEGSLPNYLVIGIGLNLNQKDFASNLNHPATSVYNELGKEIDIKKFKKTVYKTLVKEYKLVSKGNKNYLSYVKEHNFLKGQKVQALIDNKIEDIEVIDINDDNTLKAKCKEKTLNLQSGEITFHVTER